ncbi:Glycosyl hydrolases family 28 [Musa troglodytarum]|uniref:Exopolygalacturonase n=1 Tax=Musa troglodytarum TaxID=320322 RepID=A0A9E7KWY2_9LILI|nr:Glycosyl hydrolases family 28 [Musa troglodytarum]
MGLELRIIVIGLLFFIISGASVAITVGVYNVKDYGAAGDGQTDNTKAFVAAWSVACAVQGKATIVIPEGAYLLGPTIFKGPCNGIMVMQVIGQLLASTHLEAYNQYWLHFQYINGLVISGGGRFNGQGASAWPYNQCKKTQDCKPLPMNLVFSFVMNAAIKSISSIDNMFFHIHIFGSRNITFDSIKISAPGDSPNTDGIHIANSANIQVSNSVIGTGDDCISIGPGCTNLTIFRVLCGPGHGISIGSLGKNAGEKDVIGLYVSKCNLTGTTNGLRIKTLQSSPSTLKASHFRFEQIIMNNVYNPIIIDQNYCPSANCPKRYTSLNPSLVKITDIKYRNIMGTFLSPVAYNLVCSEAAPCEGVELSDINLKYNGNGKQANNASICVHVYGSSNGNVKPDPCI